MMEHNTLDVYYVSAVEVDSAYRFYMEHTVNWTPRIIKHCNALLDVREYLFRLAEGKNFLG